MRRSGRGIDGGGARPASLDLGQHAHGRADLPRCTEAALQGVVLDERLLHRMKAGRPRKALDGDEVGALVRDGERQAAQRPAAVEEHRAGTALAVIAALFRSG
jgi:hypothetical protein